MIITPVEALVAAPLIALAGVLVGALMTRRNDSFKWRRDLKIQVYFEYITAFNAAVLQRTSLEAIERQKSDSPDWVKSRAEEHNKYIQTLSQLTVASHKLVLIGSPHVNGIANMLDSMLLSPEVAEPLDTKKIPATQNRIYQAMQKDVGLRWRWWYW